MKRICNINIVKRRDKVKWLLELGELAKSVNWLNWLSYGKTFGFSPFTLDLGVLQLTIGLMIKINIASIVGIIIAIFIYRKI